jgi:hypothetical protein
MREQSYSNKHYNTNKESFRGGETKVMKKSLLSLLIFALIFTMAAPAFAAETTATQTSGQKLQALGVIQGDQNGDLMEDAEWKRQDLAVIMSRLLGVEAQAAAYAKTHTYADVNDTFYDGYLSWAKEEGLMQGHSAESFGFNESVTVHQFAAVMLRALGYDTTGENYETAKDLAVELEVVPAGTWFDVSVKRGHYYDVVVKTLGTELKDSDKTLGQELKLDGYHTSLVNASAFSETNVVVTLSNEFVGDVENLKDYFAVKTATSTFAVSAAELSTDKKKVSLTTALLPDATNLTVEFTLNGEVQTANFVYNAPSLDAALEEVNATQIKLVFNRAVDEVTAENESNYYLGLTSSISSSTLNAGWTATLQADKRTVLITPDDIDSNVLYTTPYTTGLAYVTYDGTEIVKGKEVKLQVRNIKDAAGRLMSTQEFNFLAGDTDRPTADKSTVEVDKGAATFNVKLSEGVNISTATFYYDGKNVTTDVYHLDDLTVGTTVTEASTLVVSNVDTSVVGNHTLTVVGATDLSGNSVSPNPLKVTVKVVDPTTTLKAPKVVGIEQTSDVAFRVIFDQTIDATTGKITVLNQDGDGLNADYAIGTGASLDSTYVAPTNSGYVAYEVVFTSTSGDLVYDGADAVIRTVVAENYASTAGGSTLVGAKYSKALKFVKDKAAPVVNTKTTDTKAVALGTQLDGFRVSFTDAPFNGDVQVASGDVTVKFVEDGITYNDIVSISSLNQVPGENAFEFGVTNTKFFDNNGRLKPGTFTIVLPDAVVTDDTADATPQFHGPHGFVGKTITVTVTESSSTVSVPQTDSTLVGYDATLDAIVVGFVGEDIDPATVTNKSNYLLNFTALPAGTVVEYEVFPSGFGYSFGSATSEKVALIYLPENSVEVTGNYDLRISGVATTSGAKMLKTDVIVGLVDNTLPVMTAAKVTSTKTVEVTFNEELLINTTNAVKNFSIDIGGVVYAIDTVSVVDSTTALLTTSADFDVTKVVNVTVGKDINFNMAVTDLEGNKAKEGVKVRATVDLE